MIANISNGKVSGEVMAVPSKAFGHRIMIASALCGAPTEICGYFNSVDFETTKVCLENFACDISQKTADKIIVKPKTQMTKEEVNLCMNESGSTLRFLIPVLCALGINANVDAKSGLKDRPITQLLDSLRENGAVFSGEKLPLYIGGKLNSGVYNIDASISSQYISGLLLALPLLQGDSVINLYGEAVSAGYIDITLNVLKNFGIKIEKTDRGFFIRGGQKYTSPQQISIEGDWSNSAFFLALGAISGDITVRGLNVQTVQGDSEILKVLQAFGASVECEKTGITVLKSSLRGINYDITDIPDLAPIMAVLASFADTDSVFKGVDRLKIKESDRLSAIIDMLNRVGVLTEYRNNALRIRGGCEIHSAKLDSYNDHRMVMAGAVLLSGVGGSINDIQAVEKSYPNFFEHYSSVGGKVSVTDI